MASIQLEVAVLGPLGTYTHEAAFKMFGCRATYNEQDTISDVGGILSPSVPFGVIPQENSIFGTVVETYDHLRTTSTNYIRGEVILKIDHCLIVKKGVQLHQVQKVMSHEQALGQCRDFLADKLPSAINVKTKSTAAAARELLNSPSNCAAICSSICAELFEGLEILFTGIQNESSNFTRFYSVAYSSHARLPSNINIGHELKALLRMTSTSSSDCPSDVISYIKEHNITIGRIDRRPCVDGTPFSSVYFVEIHAFDLRDRSSQRFETWTREVESVAFKAESAGQNICVIGIW